MAGYWQYFRSARESCWSPYFVGHRCVRHDNSTTVWSSPQKPLDFLTSPPAPARGVCRELNQAPDVYPAAAKRTVARFVLKQDIQIVRPKARSGAPCPKKM